MSDKNIKSAWDYRRVPVYVTKMLEIFDHIEKKRVFVNDHFKMQKNGVSIVYNNHHPNYRNHILRRSSMPNGSFFGVESRILTEPWDYKLDYYLNDRSLPVFSVHGDWFGDDGMTQNFWTESQMQDEAFMFQQGLVFDEKTLFGICCVSYLYAKDVRDEYIVAEISPDDMDRIYGEIFNSDE